MRLSPILLIHISSGTIGLLSGAAAISFRKGSRRHGLAGNIFVLSMLTMATSNILSVEGEITDYVEAIRAECDRA